MLNFREITLADREPINRLLSGAGERGGEYSFANLYIWGEQKIADGLPVIHSRFGQNYSYLYPYYDPSLIPLLRDDAHERGIRFRLFGLTAAEAEQFADEGSFTVRPVRDSFDYVYDIHRLAELRGKKLQAKRNHCNHFTEQYPDYRVLPLTAELLPRCRAFTELWYEKHLAYDPAADFSDECSAIEKAFDHFDALEMEGIVLEADGSVVAFSMGNRIRNDVFDVNFEKALAEVNGAYPMVNREFARVLRERYPELRLLNREDDMGLEGLRKAKESYYPDVLLEKFLAEERI